MVPWAQACQCQLLQVRLGDPGGLGDQLLQVHLENLGPLSDLADLAGHFRQASLSQQDRGGPGVPEGLGDPCHLGGLEFRIHFLPFVHLYLGYLALPSHQGVPVAPGLLAGLVVLVCQGRSVLRGRGCRAALVALWLLGVRQVRLLLSRRLVLLLLAFLVDLALLAFQPQRTQVVLGDLGGPGDPGFQTLAFLQDLVVLLVQRALGDQGVLVPPLPAAHL